MLAAPQYISKRWTENCEYQMMEEDVGESLTQEKYSFEKESDILSSEFKMAIGRQKTISK